MYIRSGGLVCVAGGAHATSAQVGIYALRLQTTACNPMSCRPTKVHTCPTIAQHGLQYLTCHLLRRRNSPYDAVCKGWARSFNHETCLLITVHMLCVQKTSLDRSPRLVKTFHEKNTSCFHRICFAFKGYFFRLKYMHFAHLLFWRSRAGI